MMTVPHRASSVPYRTLKAVTGKKEDRHRDATYTKLITMMKLRIFFARNPHWSVFQQGIK